MLIDSHAHLDMYAAGSERDGVIERARNAGLSAIVTVGIDPDSSTESVRIAEANDDIFTIIGVHPHDAKKVDDHVLDGIRKLAQNKKVVGIGETGLDFFRNLSPQAVQMKIFSDFLHLSGELNLPVIIHDRDAHEAVLDYLTAYKNSYVPGIIHCFSGDWKYAKICMDLGFYISIAGPVTFPKAKTLHGVVKKLPADRILLETDSPFLTPAPHRGKQNEPAYVVHTAKAVAELRGEDVEKVYAETTRNVRDVLGLDTLTKDDAETAQ
ncbi:MAG: TatD family hydrolase [Deltaproteobacteria bacterium]|nr:TatD family hydrolase [Candidatus Zymogenaceae bacterium]